MSSRVVRASFGFSLAMAASLACYAFISPLVVSAIFPCSTIAAVNTQTLLSLAGVGASLLGTGLGVVGLGIAVWSGTGASRAMAVVGLLVSLATLPAWNKLAEMQEAVPLVFLLLSPQQTSMPRDATGFGLEYTQSTALSIYKRFRLRIDEDGRFSYRAAQRSSSNFAEKTGVIDQRAVRSFIETMYKVDAFTLERQYIGFSVPLTYPDYTITMSLGGMIKTIKFIGGDIGSHEYSYSPFQTPFFNRMRSNPADLRSMIRMRILACELERRIIKSIEALPES